jgi:hypothetical protein
VESFGVLPFRVRMTARTGDGRSRSLSLRGRRTWGGCEVWNPTLRGEAAKDGAPERFLERGEEADPFATLRDDKQGARANAEAEANAGPSAAASPSLRMTVFGDVVWEGSDVEHGDPPFAEGCEEWGARAYFYCVLFPGVESSG